MAFRDTPLFLGEDLGTTHKKSTELSVYPSLEVFGVTRLTE